MQSRLAFGYIWRWNESLTVNVFDGYNEIYCYTLSEPTIEAFRKSIRETLEFVKESEIHYYN